MKNIKLLFWMIFLPACWGQLSPPPGGGGSGVSSVTGAGTVTCSPTTGSVVCTGSGGTPTGIASGDLSGTYPSPTVSKVNGAAVPASAPCLGTNGSSQVTGGCGSAPISTAVSGTLSSNVLADLPSVKDSSFGCSGSAGGTDTACMTAVAATNLSFNVPAGTYNFATALTFANPVTWFGRGSRITNLNYTGTTGTAITTNFSGSPSFGTGLRDLKLSGTSSTNSTVGLYVQGASTNTDDGGQFSGLLINGFGTGLQFGSNTWGINVINSAIGNNAVNMSVGSGTTNNAEVMDFNADTFYNDTTNPVGCVSLQGGFSWNFYGGAFDNCQLSLSGTVINVTSSGTHFQAPGNVYSIPFITNSSSSSSLSLVNPTFSLGASATVTATTLVSVSAGTITIINPYVNNLSGTSLPLVTLSGSANAIIRGCGYLAGVTTLVVNNGTGWVDTDCQAFNGSNVLSITSDRFSLPATTALLSPNPTVYPTNLLTYSNTFTNAIWGSYFTAPTIVANTTDTTDPLGGNTASKLTANGANSGLYNTISPKAVSGQTYTVSLWVKAASSVTFTLGTNDGAFITGTATTSWTRFSATKGSDGSRGFELIIPSAGAVIYVYGAQSVPGTNIGAYVQTTSQAIIPGALLTTGAVEGPTIADTGLLSAPCVSTSSAGLLQTGPCFSTAAVTLTPGTGVTSVTCTSATCDVNGGSLSIVGGTATTGTFATVSYTALATAPRTCSVSMNGGSTFLGLGHGTPSTTSFTLTSAISVLGVTFTMDYICKP